MGITCPACNKSDQTGAACARCGCDLSRLQSIAAIAATALSEAADALRAADWQAARLWAGRSWDLRHKVEAARLAFLAAAALGLTEEAMHWHERIQC